MLIWFPTECSLLCPLKDQEAITAGPGRPGDVDSTVLELQGSFCTIRVVILDHPADMVPLIILEIQLTDQSGVVAGNNRSPFWSTA